MYFIYIFIKNNKYIYEFIILIIFSKFLKYIIFKLFININYYVYTLIFCIVDCALMNLFVRDYCLSVKE